MSDANAKTPLPLKYQHHEVEEGRYQWWKEHKLFDSHPQSGKKPFTILVPPPNVTGKLHLGHAWDNALEDALIRFKHLNGFDTLFVPGLDHAGIATQTKVEAHLFQQEGKRRWDLGREGFIEEIWKWKETYSETIRQQWAKLGLALDYRFEKFTLDKDVNNLVNYVFVTLYNNGLIYRGKRIVNWDPSQKTAISNIEVIYRETPGQMYYFKYQLVDSDDYLEVATTRPETMFADQCLVVNPNDERYKKYHGKMVINPVNNMIIPVIADSYVETDFGTGVMKCTPAHDVNDFEIGERHNLAKPLCLNEDGTLTTSCGPDYAGLDRFEARDKIIHNTKQAQTFLKAENIVHQVGYSERSNTIVEPYLSNQWFVKMEPLAKLVLDFQKTNQKISFFPERFNEVLLQWMNNPQDWTISRQLWWGHQIPAWYHKETKEIYVGLEAPHPTQDWERDADVLDTWFSSALWPLVTLGWKPDQANPLFDHYYPTSVLVTGYDIIFFWVARMIFQSLYFTHQKPFNQVLIHGLVRDEQGRKMSKSLGNGVDPMDVIANYGADALRLFLLTSSTPGQDLKYNEEKVKNSWNFLNKLWNASRFVYLQLPDNFKFDEAIMIAHDGANEANNWILNELKLVMNKSQALIDAFEFGLAGKEIYDFVWNKYCSWFIELAKVNLANKTDPAVQESTQQTLVYVLQNILIMLHPFAPFITERLYQELPNPSHLSIMLETWVNPITIKQTPNFPLLLELISKIREFRADQTINKSVHLVFNLQKLNAHHIQVFKSELPLWNAYLKKLVNSELVLTTINNEKTDLISLPVKEFFLEVPVSQFIKADVLAAQWQNHKKMLEVEIERSQKILSNPNFLAKAQPGKVAEEQKKYADYQEQLKSLLEKMTQK
ncbi:valyl-tRNA synthetase [Entomoplasma freundtii]|uniref:Valine--tRNA ligase n=1 Tax=Entomoplasma freundtii TaxID=74700 RepID=A0A2K8NR90_9MOLU|nr:valine--tRNA ligase [Entomoplasma freundtii]ATZ16365.1 valyl-tRNA synthetase [Entomoplasma freundtii]TDY56596.1 valyl-tRNA synthetase [Entomoplasma freundtii]